LKELLKKLIGENFKIYQSQSYSIESQEKFSKSTGDTKNYSLKLLKIIRDLGINRGKSWYFDLVHGVLITLRHVLLFPFFIISERNRCIRILLLKST
jgi:hypothetical protein